MKEDEESEGKKTSKLEKDLWDNNQKQWKTLYGSQLKQI